GWRERMVTTDAGDVLSFALSPLPIPPPPGREQVPEGGVYEVCPAALALTSEIARTINGQGGAALIVDYGYDRPDFGETLQAVSRHGFADVLAQPGESDLSAHVDFSALAVAASAAAVHGPVSQGAFLEDLGIAQRIARLAGADPGAASSLRSGADRLTNPEEMGTLFKVLAILPKTAPLPPGF